MKLAIVLKLLKLYLEDYSRYLASRSGESPALSLARWGVAQLKVGDRAQFVNNNGTFVQ
jgi:hypothetical protein